MSKMVSVPSIVYVAFLNGVMLGASVSKSDLVEYLNRPSFEGENIIIRQTVLL